jgi:hypothetical protein
MADTDRSTCQPEPLDPQWVGTTLAKAYSIENYEERQAGYDYLLRFVNRSIKSLSRADGKLARTQHRDREVF